MATAPDPSLSYRKLQDHLATLETKCQAEETALQAATLRNRAFLHEFDERALRITQELRAVQRDTEEFIFHMDCKQSLGEHNQRLPIRRRVESVVKKTAEGANKYARMLGAFHTADVGRRAGELDGKAVRASAHSGSAKAASRDAVNRSLDASVNGHAKEAEKDQDWELVAS